jgi:hypothetical protein
MTLVGKHGFSWPRNEENLRQIKKLLKNKKGVYVLAHGGMPMYVGKGNIASRVNGHAKKTSSKSRYWDHFSWFVIKKSGFEHELEVILLRTLPFYVRSLNRQTGSLTRKERVRPNNKQPDLVPLPKLGRKKKRRAEKR